MLIALKSVVSCSSVQPSEKTGEGGWMASVVVAEEVGRGCEAPVEVGGAAAVSSEEDLGTVFDFFLGGMIGCGGWCGGYCSCRGGCGSRVKSRLCT